MQKLLLQNNCRNHRFSIIAAISLKFLLFKAINEYFKMLSSFCTNFLWNLDKKVKIFSIFQIFFQQDVTFPILLFHWFNYQNWYLWVDFLTKSKIHIDLLGRCNIFLTKFLEKLDLAHISTFLRLFKSIFWKIILFFWYTHINGYLSKLGWRYEAKMYSLYRRHLLANQRKVSRGNQKQTRFELEIPKLRSWRRSSSR